MRVLKEMTKSARLPTWKVGAIDRLIEVVPDLTWSSAISEGLDLLIQKYSSDLAQSRPQVFQSILADLSRGGAPTGTAAAGGIGHSRSHRALRRSRSAKT